MAQQEEGEVPILTSAHGVPGDEPVAAKNILPAAAEVVIASDSSSVHQKKYDNKEDYDSQSEDKAGLGNFWVSLDESSGCFERLTLSIPADFIVLHTTGYAPGSRCYCQCCRCRSGM